jgi:hypothetical protein
VWRSADQLRDGDSEGGLIARGELPEGFDDERLIEGSENGLDGRGHQQFGGLPVLHQHIAEGAAALLTGDGHQDQIASGAVIGAA